MQHSAKAFFLKEKDASFVSLSQLKDVTMHCFAIQFSRCKRRSLDLHCHEGNFASKIHCAFLCSDGGAKEDRTPDLLRARQALSQLSYSPMFVPFTGSIMVGLSGLEPPTSPLSGVRSNQLS